MKILKELVSFKVLILIIGLAQAWPDTCNRGSLTYPNYSCGGYYGKCNG